MPRSNPSPEGSPEPAARSRSRSPSPRDRRDDKEADRSRSRSRSRSPPRRSSRSRSPPRRSSRSRSPPAQRRGPPPEPKDGCKIFIGGVSFHTDEEYLRRKFSKFGPLTDVYIPCDPHTRKSRGFAFVSFEAPRDAEEAVRAMDGCQLDGREVTVNIARARPPLGSKGGGKGAFCNPDTNTYVWRRRNIVFITSIYAELLCGDAGKLAFPALYIEQRFPNR